jgi:hypothetical protein
MPHGSEDGVARRANRHRTNEEYEDMWGACIVGAIMADRRRVNSEVSDEGEAIKAAREFASEYVAAYREGDAELRRIEMERFRRWEKKQPGEK